MARGWESRKCSEKKVLCFIKIQDCFLLSQTSPSLEGFTQALDPIGEGKPAGDCQSEAGDQIGGWGCHSQESQGAPKQGGEASGKGIDGTWG